VIVLRGDVTTLDQFERPSPEVVEILGIRNGGEAAVISRLSEANAWNKRKIHCKDAAITYTVIVTDTLDTHNLFNICVSDRRTCVVYQHTANALLVCPVLAVVHIPFQLNTPAYGLPQAQCGLVCCRQNGKPSQNKCRNHEQGQQQDQRFSSFPGRVEKCSSYHIAAS
jgi:hypothetical protein